MKIVDFPGVVKQDVFYTPKKPIQNKTNSENTGINKEFNDDIISISNEAKDLLEKEKNPMLENMDDESNMIAQMLRQLEEASDHSNHPYDSFVKCIQIAMRIMNGDKVPRRDEQFLIENQPQMYSNALLLRRANDKPKKYDSLLEDEKNDTRNSGATVSFKMSSKSPSETSISSDSIEVSTDTNK